MIGYHLIARLTCCCTKAVKRARWICRLRVAKLITSTSRTLISFGQLCMGKGKNSGSRGNLFDLVKPIISFRLAVAMCGFGTVWFFMVERVGRADNGPEASPIWRAAASARWEWGWGGGSCHIVRPTGGADRGGANWGLPLWPANANWSRCAGHASRVRGQPPARAAGHVPGLRGAGTPGRPHDSW